MTDKSTEQLGTDFADGWRKLPDELKIEVLKHNLVFSKPIAYRGNEWYLSNSNSITESEEFDHDLILRHHIALGPEIATLALQVFYEKNVIKITQSRVVPTRMPPLPVRCYIVHLKGSKLNAQQSWPLISKLAANALGFNSLRYLTLAFKVLKKDCYVDICQRHVGCMPGTPIVFKCRGVVKVVSKGARQSYLHFVPHQEIRKRIQGKIVFAE
ncbi:hypothetical protein N0V95_005006 [Ascochyta clinopodiicola]|nr:hypothetical protein N0V95_005006 [Ascochyta clinopodiicola]